MCAHVQSPYKHTWIPIPLVLKRLEINSIYKFNSHLLLTIFSLLVRASTCFSTAGEKYKCTNWTCHLLLSSLFYKENLYYFILKSELYRASTLTGSISLYHQTTGPPLEAESKNQKPATSTRNFFLFWPFIEVNRCCCLFSVEVSWNGRVCPKGITKTCTFKSQIKRKKQLDGRQSLARVFSFYFLLLSLARLYEKKKSMNYIVRPWYSYLCDHVNWSIHNFVGIDWMYQLFLFNRISLFLLLFLL